MKKETFVLLFGENTNFLSIRKKLHQDLNINTILPENISNSNFLIKASNWNDLLLEEILANIANVIYIDINKHPYGAISELGSFVISRFSRQKLIVTYNKFTNILHGEKNILNPWYLYNGPIKNLSFYSRHESKICNNRSHCHNKKFNLIKQNKSISKLEYNNVLNKIQFLKSVNYTFEELPIKVENITYYDLFNLFLVKIKKKKKHNIIFLFQNILNQLSANKTEYFEYIDKKKIWYGLKFKYKLNDITWKQNNPIFRIILLILHELNVIEIKVNSFIVNLNHDLLKNKIKTKFRKQYRQNFVNSNELNIFEYIYKRCPEITNPRTAIFWAPKRKMKKQRLSNGKIIFLSGYIQSILQKFIIEYLQSRLNDKYFPHDQSYAYQKNKNVKANALVHINAVSIFSFDIKDFFGSITFKRFEKRIMNKKYFNMTYTERYSLAIALNYVSFNNNKLPLGWRSSPYISELYMIGFDKYLLKLLHNKIKNNIFKYSRYADDITISFFNVTNKKIFDEVKKCIWIATKKWKLNLNIKKTKKVFDVKKLQKNFLVTGIAVAGPHTITKNVNVGFPKVKSYTVKKIFKYTNEINKTRLITKKKLFQEKRVGLLAWINHINPHQYEAIKNKLDKIILGNVSASYPRTYPYKYEE